jgi:predicted kinase
MANRLILLRGPSGTGKSTIAKHLVYKFNTNPNTPEGIPGWVESDQFFTDLNGKYHFNIAKLKSAHQWAQLQVERHFLTGVPLVVVSNTFISHWEMESYLELAEEYDYEVVLIRSPGPWKAEVSFKRNKHNVPLDVINRHIRGYRPHPDETEWTDMSIFSNE